MNRWSLAWRGLQYYWRSHLGVVLGVIVGTTVLTGSLLVGDSVKETLRTIALNRLGNTEYSLYHPSRFVQTPLADRMQQSLNTSVAPVLSLPGMVSVPGSEKRINQIAVYGVEERFWQLGNEPPSGFDGENPSIILNRKLANQLEVDTGGTVLVRIEKPSELSRDAPLATVDDTSVSMRLTVSAVVDEAQMGRFDLKTNQVTPFNAFVPLTYLQQQVEQVGQANMLLVATGDGAGHSLEQVKSTLKSSLTLADAQLQLQQLEPKQPGHPNMEIRTDRIFLDASIIDNITGMFPSFGTNSVSSESDSEPNIYGSITYLVNELRKGDRSTPYSMVTAVGSLSDTHTPPTGFSLSDLGDDEIILNQWQADDLQAQPGDTVTLTYFVMGPLRKLIEQSSSFTVKRVIPMDDPLCDPTFMPDFPGIANTEHCRDWDPGFAIDTTKVRNEDEEYWDQYQGTPKAFVNLNTGKQMWANRFGDLTAIRFFTPEIQFEELQENIIRNLDPESVGLMFQPVREQSLAAVNQSMNFAPLFIGFSFFLIIAAAILVGLLFVFGVEQRVEESGILYALGFTVKQVRNFYMTEGFLLALIGGVIGTFTAFIYTRLMLLGLSTVWSGAVSGLQFTFSAQPVTLLSGLFGGVEIGVISLWLALRKQSKSAVRELLTSRGVYETAGTTKQSRKSLWIAVTCLVLTAVLLASGSSGDSSKAAGMFFGAASLLLIAGISASRYLFARFNLNASNTQLQLSNLGIRNTARRSGRSLAVAGLLACGSFLVIAVGANRHNAADHAQERSSGTGGFAFFGEMTLPLLHDLNTEEGANEFGLSQEDLQDVQVVALRMREGDDASCLNLNRAQKPRLLGVKPQDFAEREAFTFVGTSVEVHASPWLLLDQNYGADVVPAIADQATILWGLGKSLGDTLDYVDEQGNAFKVKLVGALANSVFQGSLLISENNYIKRYPTESGYKIALVDCPPDKKEEVNGLLTNALLDTGILLTPAAERLQAFSEVENTYLSIFQILGGLGVILGSVGIGVVVMRNVLERRGELALLRAVGFPVASIRKLILWEHWFLLVLGLGTGVVAGLVAVAPAVIMQGNDIPVLSLSVILVALFANGIFWISVAAMTALKGSLLDALRSE